MSSGAVCSRICVSFPTSIADHAVNRQGFGPNFAPCDGKRCQDSKFRRNYAHFGSFLQQGPNKVKIGAGQPCFWHKKAVFDINWWLIVNFSKCGKSFMFFWQKSIIFIFLHAGVDTFFRLGSPQTNTNIQPSLQAFVQAKLHRVLTFFAPEAANVHIFTFLKRLACAIVLTCIQNRREKTLLRFVSLNHFQGLN